MSIFRFLRGQYSPLPRLTGFTNLDAWALPALAVAGLAVFLAPACGGGVDVPTGAAAGALVTLLFYRVGFPQYQVLVFAPAGPFRGGMIRRGGRSRVAFTRRRFLTCCGSAWPSASTWWPAARWAIVCPWAWLEDALGLPTFLLGLLAAGRAASCSELEIERASGSRSCLKGSPPFSVLTAADRLKDFT